MQAKGVHDAVVHYPHFHKEGVEAYDLGGPERSFIPLCVDSEKEDALKKSIQLDSTNPAAYNHLGNVLRAQGRLQEAERCFRRAIQLDPSHPAAIYNLELLLRDVEHDHDADQLQDFAASRMSKEKGVLGNRWRDYKHLARFYAQCLGNDGCGI